MDEYNRIRKQIEISELLVKYKNKACTYEEHEQVIQFMNISLKSFVQSRLTEEELITTAKYISQLETKQQLQEYIELHQIKYEDLSTYDAYILFMVKEKIYHLNQKELNENPRNFCNKVEQLAKNIIYRSKKKERIL